ncbi:MAG: bifunctional nuclease family protein [Desulfovibrio sp.]|nr:bifunctional nuclease family protein [Desulfovibrio sp.]
MDTSTEESVYLLTLSEADGPRYLTIEIGAMEGMILTFVLNREKLPRPLTHDLLLLCLKALQASFVKAEITALRQGMYYAAIELHRSRKRIRIDCRPADAITLACRTQKPIYVKESLLKGLDEEDESPQVEKDCIPYMRTPDAAADMARTASASHILDIMSLTRESREERSPEQENEEKLLELLKSLEPETRHKM